MKRCPLAGVVLIGLAGLAYAFYVSKGDDYISLIHSLPDAQAVAEEKG